MVSEPKIGPGRCPRCGGLLVHPHSCGLCDTPLADYQVQAPPVKPPAPDLDADLLAALRSALAAGVGVEGLIARVRGEGRPWTYCADAMPSEWGGYEVAVTAPVGLAASVGPKVIEELLYDPQKGRFAIVRECTPYAWRPLDRVPPPLRPADRFYLIDNGVPAEWLGAPEED